MLTIRKRWMLGLTAAVLAAMTAMPVYGSSRKTIKSVNLTIKADIEPDTDYGMENIDIETSSNRFSVDDYEVLNEEFGWQEDTIPRIRITLIADDDYYFESLPKDKIILRGGAELIQASREDGNTTLLVDVKLPSFQTSLQQLSNVALSEEGIASWGPVGTAGSYEVRVYRDGAASGASITTKAASYNCRGRMGKGEIGYTVKVRAVSKFDKSEIGEWVESPSVYITGERAAEFRENPTGGSGRWVQAADGRWWYEEEDGTYPKDSWKQVGDKWYFFDGEGYMKIGWVQWDGQEYYCSESGEMLTDCMTPDSYWVGTDGAKIAQ